MMILDKASYHKNMENGETIPSLFLCNADNHFWTPKLMDQMHWFHFQDL